MLEDGGGEVREGVGGVGLMERCKCAKEEGRATVCDTKWKIKNESNQRVQEHVMGDTLTVVFT